jgi:hypothetical protein
MAKGRAVSIVMDDVEKRDLTVLTRKHGAPQALAERGAHKAGCDVNASSCGCRPGHLSQPPHLSVSPGRGMSQVRSGYSALACLLRTLRPETNIGAKGQER